MPPGNQFPADSQSPLKWIDACSPSRLVADLSFQPRFELKATSAVQLPGCFLSIHESQAAPAARLPGDCVNGHPAGLDRACVALVSRSCVDRPPSDQCDARPATPGPAPPHAAFQHHRPPPPLTAHTTPLTNRPNPLFPRIRCSAAPEFPETNGFNCRGTLPETRGRRSRKQGRACSGRRSAPSPRC